MLVLLMAGYYEHKHNQYLKLPPVPLGSGAMFDNIAQYYDKANAWMSLGWHKQWKKVMVREMDIYGSDLVLDVATGTGDVAIEIAYAMKERGKLTESAPTIVGVDPSKEMILIAKRKIDKETVAGRLGSNYITFKVGSAGDGDSDRNGAENSSGSASGDYLDLDAFTVTPPVPGDVDTTGEMHLFDKVSIAFGLRVNTHRENILASIRKVTKRSNPNGKLTVLEVFSPSSTGILGLLNSSVTFFSYYIVPILGTIASDGHWTEFSHIRNTVFSPSGSGSMENDNTSSSPQAFADMIMSAGFYHCEHKDIFLGTVYLFTCSTYDQGQGQGGTEGKCTGAENTEQCVSTGTGTGKPAAILRQDRRQRRGRNAQDNLFIDETNERGEEEGVGGGSDGGDENDNALRSEQNQGDGDGHGHGQRGLAEEDTSM